MSEKPPEVEDDEIVEALERIAKDDEDGLIQPPAVVEAARDPQSPLHQFFEWDDTEAAAQYRLEQARKLITRVRIRVQVPETLMWNVRVVQSDGTERRGYVDTVRVRSDPNLYEQIIDDAKRAIRAYRNRLSAFPAASDLVAQLDEILGNLK
jgi:hypothetical protein